MDFNLELKPNGPFYDRFETSPYDEIVISGISGRFPNSRNVDELAYNLNNKIDCCDDREVRFPHRKGIPKRHGTIHGLEKFDASFFGMNQMVANASNPQIRCFVEEAFAAVLDAGMNLVDMKGSNTGVYTGCISMESSEATFKMGVFNGYSIVGESRGMLSSRVSYAMDLKGPCFMVDSACSSGVTAFNNAYMAIRSGECDAAIVGGANLCMSPLSSLQFAKLGVTSADGYCRPFDQNATGYTRAEAISAIFLQKRKFAKRVYATVVHSKINCDGYKPEGITYPSCVVQQSLLDKFYQEINLNPSIVDYIEAHGTATIVGDTEECRAIYQTFCKNRKDPLLIGSVKSSIGHTEPVSALCSIVKLILTLESGKISPNIHFEKPKDEITALKEGHLKVVTELTDLPGPLVACSSFGFGGSNGHVLLRQHPKRKINFGIPADGLPRLVCWSGRTEESCNVVFDDIVKRPLDAEFVGLVHNCQSKSLQAYMYRGYGVFSQEGDGNATCVARAIERSKSKRAPMVWVYSGMGSQWAQMGSSLMALPIFRQSIEASHRLMEGKGLNLIEIITSEDPKIFDNILHSFVGIAAIQIALTDILWEMNLEPDYIIGHSVGELGCAYADKCLTAEEMLMCVYYRGLVSIETEVIHGSMAAIGLSYKQILPMLPEGIEVACHNGPNSCTLSGPSNLVAKFVKELTDKDIFAREVPCSNIPYHSKYIANMGPKLFERLQNVITLPKERSAKWLSSSVPKSDWDTPEAKFCSATYQTNNLLSSVLFEETMRYLPENAVTVEIAPHGLIQAILKKAMPESTHISLTQRGNLKNINILLSGLGKIYTQGFDMPVEKLYPPVEFPVSAETPKISPLIRWDHSIDYKVVSCDQDRLDRGAEQKFNIVISNKEDEYITGHKIDGRLLYPATGYLYLAWVAFARYQCEDAEAINQPVEISNVKLVRATSMKRDSNTILKVVLHPGTGKFEITESNDTVVTGTIKALEKFIEPSDRPEPSSDAVMMGASDFYKELRLRGYNYDGEFKSVKEAASDGSVIKIAWKDNFVSFMDCMLQNEILKYDSRTVMIPTSIETVQIDPKLFMESLPKVAENEPVIVEVHSIKEFQCIETRGIRIQGLEATSIMRRKPPGEPILETYQFIPYILPQNLNLANALRVFVQLGLEISPAFKFKVLEIGDETCKPVISYVQRALEDLPLVAAELTLLSDEPDLEIPGITIDAENDFTKFADCLFIIARNIASDSAKLEEISRSCKDEGFIISMESYDFDTSGFSLPSTFELLSVIAIDGNSLLMMRHIKKREERVATYLTVSIHDKEFQWLDKAKEAIKQGTLYLISENEPENGLIGFVNCLRKEPKSEAICIFIDDKSAPKFDPELPFYREQIEKGLAINVLRDGVWGSYRHLPLETPKDPQPQKSHCFASNLVKGDLSSLAWFAGKLDVTQSDIVRVRYASLNFRDVMIATGKLDVNMVYSRHEQDCITGYEFSGITGDGKRVMGMSEYGAMATHVKTMDYLTWQVPPHWTLEEAVTIPVVYATVYTAFFVETQIQRGKKILIHAGTGGIGLSAIRVALHYGLDVFTTVSTEQKKEYLLTTFPSLRASQIGNSRDTSFYKMVMGETKGAGVDYVLNSLADDKLIASLKCLAENGHFLEIGKYDILNDSKIGLGHFKKNITFHVIMLDRDMRFGESSSFSKVHQLIETDIKNGIIVPLKSTVFEANDIEKAFRFLASAKHIGKVLLKVRDDDFSEESVPIVKHPVMYFKPNLSYVIPGGLGGFGLELADWIVLRGCKNLVLSSSKGISKPYQQYRINLWRSYGVQVVISTDDITTPEGCHDLIKAAMELGPVGGIFNLAVLLRDELFENMDGEKFKESLAVKAYATKYLDEISRKLCPHLEHFVVFSSVSCGRGNVGQTNYGMANSVMERVVEARVRDGLPGKAIQWGAIGEVGLVAQMAENRIDMEIGGTLQQRISSCLQVLDILLSCPDAVVGSMVVAEKRACAGAGIVETVMNIIGIKDVKSIPMDQKLSEVGMDSLMAVEIKQTLERDYDLVLSPQQLRDLTLQSLTDMASTKSTKKVEADSKQNFLDWSFRNLGDSETFTELIMKLNTKQQSKDCAIILPGVEGLAGKIWNELGEKLNFSAKIVQYINAESETLEEIVDELMEKIREQILNGSETFTIIAYSFGSLLALTLVRKLETLGISGKLVLIEGSPLYLKKPLETVFSSTNNPKAALEFHCAATILGILAPNKSQDSLLKCKSYGEMIEFIIIEGKDAPFSDENKRMMMYKLRNHVKIVYELDVENFPKIKSNIMLIRASEPMLSDIDEDYDLSDVTTGEVTMKCIEGNHMTIMETNDLAETLNEIVV
ncbi:fatty acid synthase-like [Culicoides brevitarsis]|uniref:fatty acid synthase-like n=1 Tax=Culicoides brevitarsis TaxID=469753 RepID=UPI00307C2EC5